jgi:hypothetical protein
LLLLLFDFDKLLSKDDLVSELRAVTIIKVSKEAPFELRTAEQGIGSAQC